jgi:hypothetical protein
MTLPTFQRSLLPPTSGRRISTTYHRDYFSLLGMNLLHCTLLSGVHPQYICAIGALGSDTVRDCKLLYLCFRCRYNIEHEVGTVRAVNITKNRKPSSVECEKAPRSSKY